MWYDIQENVVSSTLNEAEEVNSPMSPQYMPAMAQRFLPSMRPRYISTNSSDNDSESESDEEVLEDGSPHVSSNCKPVDLLLLKSLEPYAAVQRTTAVRQLRCECSEVLAVSSDDQLHAARVLRPPLAQVLWPRRRNRTRALVQSSSTSTSAPISQNEPLSENTNSIGSSSTMASNATASVTCSSSVSIDETSSSQESSLARRRFNFVQSLPPASLLATQVANRVIKYARCARNIHEEDMCCLNCGLFPICPVTGRCGHTRCTKCVEMSSRCPCGHESSKPLFVNILIRDLIGKKTADCPTSRSEMAVTALPKVVAPPRNKLLNGVRESSVGPVRIKRSTRPNTIAPISVPNQQNIPMSARARFNYALELLQNGKHKDAAPQLALAAASYHADLRVARPLLAQVIVVLSKDRDPRGLTQELNRLVRHLSSPSWIKTDDMECILCCDIFTKPVTTPCGHMFCRTCLEKTLDYRKRCPLCLRGLGDFKLTETNDTVFVKGALAAINALNTPKPMEEYGLVPIFVCTVAYPSVPCPLFIFDPRYWMMIRRVLESGSRRFGMVAMDREKKYADYGTILEVRDCVHLEDGRSILSTIGLSRFKVIERSVHDGCEVARIQPIHDIPPDEGVATDDLKLYASQIMFKAVLWLSTLGSKVLSDIENAFGSLPTVREEDNTEEWWESSDGPAWLWWLVAVLPLRMEIKVLILSTDCLIKRMMAVARTLEAVDHVTLTTMSPGQYQVRVTVPTNNTFN